MALESVDPMQTESVLIYRKALDVLLQAITPVQHGFVLQLQAGTALAQAVDGAVASDASFDLPGTLATLIRQQLIIQIH
jgi:hypothetical protein